MTGRGRGAPAGQGARAAGDQERAAARRAVRRPVLVELASAVLVVGGVLNLIISIDVLLRLADRGEQIGPYTAVTIALAISVLGLGLLIRFGRAWLVTVNVAAVLGFLELTSGSVVGLLLGALDVVVVLALVRERPWFEWSKRERELAAADRAAARRA